MKNFAIALALSLAVTAPAFAQGPDDYTEYDFEDDLVLGDLVRPDGELVQTARRWHSVGLIRIRDNFIDRLLASADWL
jgi:hypothetical protein